VTARHWTSHVEWYAHKRDGLAAGIAPSVIDAIAQRCDPEFTDPAAKLVHDYTRQLLASGRVPDDLHALAAATLGTRGVVDLVGIIGYYGLVALTLNAFDIGLPDGETPELEP
jgi:4-carboxymuconolactone decarboxylase